MSPRNQGGRCGREKNKGENLLQMYQWKGLENIGGVGGGWAEGRKAEEDHQVSEGGAPGRLSR